MWRIARPAGVVSGKPASVVNPVGVVWPIFGIKAMDCGFEVSTLQLISWPSFGAFIPRHGDVSTRPPSQHGNWRIPAQKPGRHGGGGGMRSYVSC
jgi:hypothetical protein